MYRPQDIRIAGPSVVHIVLASSSGTTIPDTDSPPEVAKRVAVTIRGTEAVFFSFTSGSGTVTVANGHRQSPEDGLQVYYVNGNTHFNTIAANTGSTFGITPLDN